ncbi:MAG: histidine phosphatase family protein [Halothermotrichaceae bacterium]
METNIYFIRHAESDFTPDDDNYIRPLTEKGKEDAERLIKYFSDINITKALSSPYHRAVHTIKGVAENKDLEIELIDDFRERNVADSYLDDEEFMSFVENQWNDFDYSMQGGESFNQVQERGIRALEEVIHQYAGENMIIGTHGTWLAVILNYFDERYDLEFWKTLKMPDAFQLKFIDCQLRHIERLTDILE